MGIITWSIRAGTLAILLLACTSAGHDKLLPIPLESQTDARLHNEQGIQEFQSGSWSRAQYHFEEAVRADPSLAPLHYNLGLVLYRLGKGRAAEQHFKEAAQLDPSDPIISSYRKLSSREDMPESPQDRVRRSSGGSSDGHSHSH